MRLLISMLGLLLAFAVSAEPESRVDPKPEHDITVTGDIEIARDGSVHRHSLDKNRALTPAITQVLDKGIRGWRFEPITVDGRAVIARTRMQIELEARPLGDEYLITVANVWFGQPSRRSGLRPPQYPESAVYAGLGAKVILVLQLDATGKVLQVHPEQTSLSMRADDETIAESWRDEFVKASVRVAKRWKFDIAEIIDGQPTGTSVRVPIEYIPPGGSDRGWNSYLPGPYQPVPWFEVETLAAQLEDLQDGDLQSLDSRFKLKGEVIGSTL